MPNHVTNKMVFYNDAALALVMELKMRPQKNNTAVDFNVFVEEPSTLGDNWYGWRNLNWGTKWNAYDCSGFMEEGGLTIVKFDTAWTTPMGIWEAIAKKYPEAEIEVWYADEDTGYNLGHILIRDGRTILEEYSEYSPHQRATLLNEVYSSPGHYFVCEKRGDYICDCQDDDDECRNCMLEAED